MIWRRLEQDSKPKPDEGGAHRCLGAGAGQPWEHVVTPYNYTTVVKAPESRVAVAVVGRRAAGGGCPASHLLSPTRL